MILSFTLIPFFVLSSVSALLFNVTIDDTAGDPETRQQITYFPPEYWLNGTECRSCAATPLINPAQVYNGTWHTTTSGPVGSITSAAGLRFATVPFHGTAIYVYCILINNNSQEIRNTYTELTFEIDFESVGTFVHVHDPSASEMFTYKALVYANQSLPDGNHTLTIQNGQVDGPISTVLLDYIVYSYDKPAPPTHTQTNPSPSITSINNSSATSIDTPTSAVKDNNTAKIIGGFFAAISVILFCLLGLLWRRQRSCSHSHSNSKASEETGDSDPPTRPVPGWFRRPGKRIPYPPSRFSFHPNLFVSPSRNTDHAEAPPIVTVLPTGRFSRQPNSLHGPSPHLERTPSPQVLTSPPPLDPRADPIEPLSITDWQRRTHIEATALPPPSTIMDVGMSSFYASVDPPTTEHPPRPPQRRFAVVNN